MASRVTLLSVAALVSAPLCCLVDAVNARAPVPRHEYVFRLDTDRWVELVRNGNRLFGKFDVEGNFVQELRYPAGAELSCRPNATPITPCRTGSDCIAVYEYRSGYLILGALRADGNFVPNLNGKVTAFKDYSYGRGVLPIWNLPGYFIKTTDLKKGDAAPRYGHMLGTPD